MIFLALPRPPAPACRTGSRMIHQPFRCFDVESPLREIHGNGGCKPCFTVGSASAELLQTEFRSSISTNRSGRTSRVCFGTPSRTRRLPNPPQGGNERVLLFPRNRPARGNPDWNATTSLVREEQSSHPGSFILRDPSGPASGRSRRTWGSLLGSVLGPGPGGLRAKRQSGRPPWASETRSGASRRPDGLEATIVLQVAHVLTGTGAWPTSGSTGDKEKPMGASDLPSWQHKRRATDLFAEKSLEIALSLESER